MKLVLKQCNDLGSMGLYDENGDILPCQVSTSIISTPNEVRKVIVTFDAYPGDENFVIVGDVYKDIQDPSETL